MLKVHLSESNVKVHLSLWSASITKRVCKKLDFMIKFMQKTPNCMFSNFLTTMNKSNVTCEKNDHWTETYK